MIATRPARNPLTVKLTSHFLLRHVGENIAVRPAAQAASVVLAATRPIPTKSIAESVLPGLKSVPAEPQEQSAGCGDRQIVRQHRAAAVALELAAESRTENDRAGQRDEAADGVHDGRSGEVVEAHPSEARKLPSLPMWPGIHPVPRPSGR